MMMIVKFDVSIYFTAQIDSNFQYSFQLVVKLERFYVYY